jgi:hypothetical protein
MRPVRTNGSLDTPAESPTLLFCPDLRSGMRMNSEPVSGIERLASITVAIGATAAFTLAVFAAALQKSVLSWDDKPARDAVRISESVAYVNSPSTAAARSPTPSVLRVETRRTGPAPLPVRTSRERTDSVISEIRPESSRPKGPLGAASTTSQLHWAAPAVSPRLQPGFAPYGEGLKGIADATNLATSPTLTEGPLKRASNSQDERDVNSRAADLASIAARGAGLPISRVMSGGARIDSPLPFGGPSRKERQRDSTINAETKEILAKVQRRSDSVATARRRYSDSLASLEDSLRRMRGRDSTLP